MAGTEVGPTEGPRLHTEIVPPAPGRRRAGRLVLVHGFTQTGRSWAPIARRLAVAGHEVALPDLPGHGGSTDIRADLPSSARLLGQEGGRATYVGYSMGARICLHLALARPDLVKRLVLLGSTAGIEDPEARAERRLADEALAATLDPGPHQANDPMAAARRLDVFLDTWLTNPMWATLSADAANVADRRRNTPAGLASSLRLAGTGTQQPLWDLLQTLAMPTLVMAGALDATFGAHATRMGSLIGSNATVALVSEAGHAAHLERSEAFTAAICRFVGDVRGGREQDFTEK